MHILSVDNAKLIVTVGRKLPLLPPTYKTYSLPLKDPVLGSITRAEVLRNGATSYFTLSLNRGVFVDTGVKALHLEYEALAAYPNGGGAATVETRQGTTPIVDFKEGWVFDPDEYLLGSVLAIHNET